MMPSSATGVSFDLGRVCLGTPPSTLGALGFFLFGGLALGLFPGALSPSLNPAGLFLFLPTCFVFLLLFLAPLPPFLVLGAARLFGCLPCNAPFHGLFLGTPGSTRGTTCFALDIGLSSTMPSSLVVSRRVGGTTARLRARVQARICLVSLGSFQNAAE
jgi:hypothetical protein